jgi:CDGSH-type Zn-finger protein
MAECVSQPIEGKKITIEKNGPYNLPAGVPLVRRTQVVSEYGEPLTWKTTGVIETPAKGCDLCRCGQSENKPFCDGTHHDIGFDGRETADTGPTAGRQFVVPGGTRIIVRKDPALCMNSGFCGWRDADLEKVLGSSTDPRVRSLVMAMVERCPSGSLTYRIEENDPDIEPDLPQQVALTTEITGLGPVEGPLWVTGCIPVERSDGNPFETRNRVTLCNCGHSGSKPLCDGTHRTEAEEALRRKKGR